MGILSRVHNQTIIVANPFSFYTFFYLSKLFKLFHIKTLIIILKIIRKIFIGPIIWF